MILICGDVHGNSSHMRYLLERAEAKQVKNIIQVGDFGLVWNSIKPLVALSEVLVKKDMHLWVLLGNHENYDLWESALGCTPDDNEIKEPLPNVHHLPRGQVFDLEGIKFMAFGGAVSVDQDVRVSYISWWQQENITEPQAYKVVDNPTKVDVLLTHELPECPPMMVKWLEESARLMPSRLERMCKAQRVLIRKVFDAVNPTLTIHGHYHYRYTDLLDGKRIIGLGRDNSGKDSWVLIGKESLA